MKFFDRFKYVSSKKTLYTQEDSTSDKVIGAIAVIAFILIVLFA
jgi:hypothetical protein